MNINYEDFKLLGDLNDWLKKNDIKLINIETVICSEVEWYRVWFYTNVPYMFGSLKIND